MNLLNNWFIAVVFALIVVAVLAWIMEKAVYLPLNKKQSNQSISLIASMGILVVIVNLVAMLFGNENKMIGSSLFGSVQFESIILTKVQLIQLIAAVLAIAVFHFYMKYSKGNLVMQAISNNETISKVFGIKTEKARANVFIAGSLLACIAGILKSIEVGINPQMGLDIILAAVVIAIIVPRLKVFLLVIASIGLSVLQNTVEWFLNAQWEKGITYFILLLVILFKTEGIISYNLRKDRA